MIYTIYTSIYTFIQYYFYQLICVCNHCPWIGEMYLYSGTDLEANLNRCVMDEFGAGTFPELCETT